MSIQLKLGGHSFSADTLPAEALAEDVEVFFEVLTPRCLLVARELVQGQEDGAHYLAAAGIPLADGECALWSDAEAVADSCAQSAAGIPLADGECALRSDADAGADSCAQSAAGHPRVDAQTPVAAIAESAQSAAGIPLADGECALWSDAEAGADSCAQSAAGIPLADGECALWSDAEAGADSCAQSAAGHPRVDAQTPVAAIAVNRCAVAAIRERLGNRAHFTTPLRRRLPHEGATVWIYRAEEVLYIKVWDARLRFAEAVPASTEADILYFITLLGREFPLRNYTLVTAGQDPKALRKLLGKQFKKALCES